MQLCRRQGAGCPLAHVIFNGGCSGEALAEDAVLPGSTTPYAQGYRIVITASYGGVDSYSIRPYTGNIIWNDVEESEEASGGVLPSTGGMGATPIVMGCGAGLILIGGIIRVVRRRRYLPSRYDFW